MLKIHTIMQTINKTNDNQVQQIVNQQIFTTHLIAAASVMTWKT